MSARPNFLYMTKYTVLLALSLYLTANVQAQVGSPLPSMQMEDLNGAAIEMPAAFEGKFALIGLATTKKAEDELRTWQVPVYNKFVAKTGMMDEMFKVEVYFVPVFTGANKAAKSQVVKKLRENNEKIVKDHLLIYSGEKDSLNKLGVDDKKTPYFYLVDEMGIVRWSAEGAFRQKYLEEIESVLLSN